MKSPITLVAATVDPPPTVFECGRFTHASRHFAENHRTHTFMVHLFAYRGHARIGQTQYAFEDGDILVSPADTDIRYDFPCPGTHWCLRLLMDRGRTGNATLGILQHLRLGNRRFMAQHRLNAIHDDWSVAREQPLHPHALAARLGATAFLAWLAGLGGGREDRPTEPRPVHARLLRAVDLAAELLRHPESRGLAISEIARRSRMSQNRLMAAFRQVHNESMVSFRNRHSMSHAQWILDTTELSLQEARSLIGIDDPHHFNKLFRRYVGIAPQRYRLARKPVLTSAVRTAPRGIPARRRPD